MTDHDVDVILRTAHELDDETGELQEALRIAWDLLDDEGREKLFDRYHQGIEDTNDEDPEDLEEVYVHGAEDVPEALDQARHFAQRYS